MPERDERDGAAEGTMLHLPDDLLRQIGHLAVGKTCREVCSRLRGAYGPPPGSAVIWQAQAHDRKTMNLQYNYYSSLMRAEDLESLCDQQRLVLASIGGCAPRWPAWAQQVTRLELASECGVGPSDLLLVHQALPSLQHLSCAAGLHPDSHKGGGSWEQVPHFTALATLCLMCSISKDTAHHEAANFGLLSVVPHLQRLHLDLRHLTHHSGLEQALRPLAHLTHLELLCGPSRFRDCPGMLTDTKAAEVCGALAVLVGRLQSLVLLSPAADLGPGLLAVLPTLTCLTSLGWCAQSQSYTGSHSIYNWDIPPSRFLPRCSLRRLVIGAADPYKSIACCYARGLGELAGVLGGQGAGARCKRLEALVLPAVAHEESIAEWGPDSTYTHTYEGDGDVPMRALQHLAGAVVAQCPALTSLHLNVPWCHDGPGFTPPADVVPCLREVFRMQRLRQLVLELPAGFADHLGSLAALPDLRELWLGVAWGGKEQQQTGSSLSQLTGLTHLAMKYTYYHNGSSLWQTLLGAAARLPQLQVLHFRVERLVSKPDTWLPLLAAPPPRLTEVHVSPDYDRHAWS